MTTTLPAARMTPIVDAATGRLVAWLANGTEKDFTRHLRRALEAHGFELLETKEETDRCQDASK